MRHYPHFSKLWYFIKYYVLIDWGRFRGGGGIIGPRSWLHWPLCARSMCHDLGPNIFPSSGLYSLTGSQNLPWVDLILYLPSSPTTQSISTWHYKRVVFKAAWLYTDIIIITSSSYILMLFFLETICNFQPVLLWVQKVFGAILFSFKSKTGWKLRLQ